MTVENGQDLRDVAYWRSPSWSPTRGEQLKTLLLFFDGIAVLAGDGFKDQAVERDPVFAGPIADLGLLHVLDAEALIDEEMADDLREIVRCTLDTEPEARSSRFPGPPWDDYWDAWWECRDDQRDWLPLSLTRGGWIHWTPEHPSALDLLIERGLARTEERVGYVHPWAYSLLMLALQQLIRRPAENLGLALQPVTATPASWVTLQNAIARADGRQPLSAATVVSYDLDVVTLNLASVPLDEVLAFRDEHGAEYRAYARDLRSFVREIGTLEARDRASALVDRHEELADTAEDLRKLARRSWRRPMASFSLGIAGAAVALAAGNLPTAAIAVGGGLLGLRRQSDPGTAYAYLFRAQRELSTFTSQ
jgi:hypothetical protein